MLELYHHGSSVCAAKVRFALNEKGIEWKGHYLDILKGDQFDPEYMKLNPKAVVPTIVHDGHVIVESTVICEYVDETFNGGVSLVPDTPLERAKMRLWTKIVDEDIHPACGELTFVACHRHVILRMGPEAVDEFLNATPARSVTATWKERKRQLVMEGFDAPGIGAKVKLYDKYLGEMEAALRDRKWLAGDTFSLADVGLTPYVNRLDMLGMSGLWEKGRRPHVEDWFNRIKARPTFKETFLDWCPEDLTNDLMTFGTQSWPNVLKILDMSDDDCRLIPDAEGMCMCAIG